MNETGRRALLIAGPSASGKTGLAVNPPHRDGELVLRPKNSVPPDVKYRILGFHSVFLGEKLAETES